MDKMDIKDIIAFIEADEEEIKGEIRKRAKSYKLEDEDIYAISVPKLLETAYFSDELRYHEFEVGQIHAYSKVKKKLLKLIQ